MSAYIFYTLALAFGGGVLLRSFFIVSYDWLVACIFVALLFSLLWLKQHSRGALLVSLALLAVALGVIRADIQSWYGSGDMLAAYLGVEIDVVGEVVREPEVRENTTHVYVRPLDQSEIILVYAPRHVEVAYGDVVSLRGELEVPQAFETDLGRTFNYAGFLRAKGVSYVLFRPELTAIGSDQGNVIMAWLLHGKQALMTSIESVLPEPHAGLGEGLLLGVKSALGEQWEMVFRRTGIIHIVVLSGYNVMLVVTFVLALLSYVCGLRVRLVVGLAAIVAFACMVGLSATVVRASIMASLILVAHATGRRYEVMRALFLAGLVMVISNPYLLAFDPGFQLSFLATIGLILIGPLIEAKITGVPSVFGMRSFLTATVATQIFVLPFLLYQIGEFSLVSVLVNVLVLPMVPVAMLLAFMTGVVGLVHAGLATMIGYMAFLSLSYILFISERFAALPFAAYTVPAFHWTLMLGAYVLLGWVLWRIMRGAGRDEDDGVLAGWTIEVENETGPAQSAGPEDVPIFFR